ncbi:MAG: hypothetical protein JSW39_16305, partial [Desulfobacterales bacterium]
MRLNPAQKAAFGFYNLSWSLALPLLRLNRRLAQGFDQRTLHKDLPAAADLWIQAASVGESFLAAELLKRLDPVSPVKILLTSNTPQGVDILKGSVAELKTRERRLGAQAAYFPFDQPSLMERAVRAIRPRVVVLLETELWPGLLHTLKNRGIKILLVNGRITDRSLKRYLWWPSLWQRLRPDKILAISEDDARRFARLFGRQGVEVMPNMKFDRIRLAAAPDDPVKPLVPRGIPFMVLGSVRRQEEPAVKRIIRAVHRRQPQTVIGLFPRHLQRLAYWQQTLNRWRTPWTLRSTAPHPVALGTVILWDTFGELARAYGLA